jgi:hypothetical protein
MGTQQRHRAIQASGRVSAFQPARADMLRAFGLPALAVALACAALMGCAGERPQSTTTPGLETGITSNNGGGQRALGNQVNESITVRTR